MAYRLDDYHPDLKRWLVDILGNKFIHSHPPSPLDFGFPSPSPSVASNFHVAAGTPIAPCSATTGLALSPLPPFILRTLGACDPSAIRAWQACWQLVGGNHMLLLATAHKDSVYGIGLPPSFSLTWPPTDGHTRLFRMYLRRMSIFNAHEAVLGAEDVPHELRSAVEAEYKLQSKILDSIRCVPLALVLMTLLSILVLL